MTTDLALTRPDPTMDEGSLRVMMAVADRYVKSGLLPAAIKTPQQALVIMGMGRELGVPATVALRGISVINGKPTCSAELMMALVHRTYGQSAMRVYKTDSKSCTVQFRQAGWDGISEHTFTIEEAEQAGLFKNPVWKQYPAAMLRARAISAAVRFAFPECISGVYTPEEMGADVSVVDGEVVVTDEKPADAGDGTGEDDDEPVAFSYWTDARQARWAAGEAEARRIGADIPQMPPADATDDAVKGALRKLGDSIVSRRQLITDLEDAVKQVQDAGGFFDMPDDLPLTPDAEVRDMIQHARDTLEAAKAA